MFTIIKLGGCNGSGKTSVARALLNAIGATPRTWKGAKKSPNYYYGEYGGRPVLVLGSYETTCGGMDTISDKLERFAFVEWAARHHPECIVFFEGLITGKTYGALGELSEQHHTLGSGKWLYAFMDTPFEVCVERVLARRAEAGNAAPFDPERTMRPTFQSCEHLREKLLGQRVGRTEIPTYHAVMALDHKKKPATLAKNLLVRAEKLL